MVCGETQGLPSPSSSASPARVRGRWGRSQGFIGPYFCSPHCAPGVWIPTSAFQLPLPPDGDDVLVAGGVWVCVGGGGPGREGREGGGGGGGGGSGRAGGGEGDDTNTQIRTTEVHLIWVRLRGE